MGCCVSSPHAKRRYRDPADFDEEFVSEEDLPLRTFGKFRGNCVIVPDDVDGLPSTRDSSTLATDPDTLLYQAEMDNGIPWRCARPILWTLMPIFPFLFVQLIAVGHCSCDQVFCWVRKEYSTRSYFRIYPNRIEVNYPHVRFPWGLLGCGSWNADRVIAHPFDRGAFGFHRVQCGVCYYACCFVPLFGDVVARQRCQCNGPLWHGGWWCDEWPCKMFICTYRYTGLADGDEVAFAANLALQAYFEGRHISAEDMEKCLEYWRQNVSEYHDQADRKRDVICRPHSVPCVSTVNMYKTICQCPRKIPFQGKQATRELKRVYEKYENLRQRQMERYENFKHPVRLSTVCRAMGCRRVFGRKGLIFCTEGCSDNKAIGCCYKKLDRQPQDPFPPPAHQDLDDQNHAAFVLWTVLGNPTKDVVYRGWEWDSATGKYSVVTNQGTESKEPEPKESTVPSMDTTNQHNGRPTLLGNGHLIQNGIPSTAELSLPSDPSVCFSSTNHQNGACPVAASRLFKGKFDALIDL